MGAADSEVSIRQILPGEEKTVREFFEKNLGIIDSIIFQLSVGHAMESARQ